MKVFIAWSGDVSEKVADGIHNWLPKVIQAVEPWMSEHNIDKGGRWNPEIAKALSDTNFGIVCLTPENLDSRWIHFEVGALAKSVEESLIWTYLFNVRPSNVKQPLGQYQHTIAKKEDTKKLLATINRTVKERGENAIISSAFNDVFEVWWPKLDDYLGTIQVSETSSTVRRSERELLEEAIDLIRQLSRSDVSYDRLGIDTSEVAQIVNEINAVKRELQKIDNERNELLIKLQALAPGEEPINMKTELKILDAKKDYFEIEINKLLDTFMSLE